MFLAKRSICVIATFALLTISACSSMPESKVTGADRARMLVEIANGAIAEGDPTGALQNLARAEAEDDSLPELHHSKALAYHLRREPAKAIQCARRALELKPEYADANNTLGKLLLDDGKLTDAEAPLMIAAENPLYEEAFKPLTNLGILHYRQNQWEKSQSYFDRAILASPQAACIAYYYRGHLELKQSQFNEAVRDYQQASRKLCTGFLDAHLALGIAYERGRQYSEARKKFLEIQQRYPNTKVAEQAVSHLRTLPN